VRQAALGVERAVDRVNDHRHAGVAVVDLAELLGDQLEAVSFGFERIELGHDDQLSGAVDDERAVATGAA
jgi:hypothetical protein